MARYGNSINYGSGINYGVSAAPEAGAVMWHVQVDWGGGGGFGSENEAGRLVDLSIDRGRSCYLAPQGRGFEHVRPGRAVLTLDNHDRRYDPRNGSSPLSPNVKPGRLVYIGVTDLSTNTHYPVFTGTIDDIVPMYAPGGGEVQIVCVDFMAQLNDQTLSTGASRQNTTISGALEALMTDAGYPSWWSLDTDDQPVIVFGVTDQNAGGVAHELADAALGTFFVDVNGTARFYARNHTYSGGTSLAQTQILNVPVLAQPWQDVYNHITCVTARPIKEQASVVWFLPGPVSLTAGAPATLDIDYDEAFDVQLGQYAAWSNADGSGTNETGNLTVTTTLSYNGGSATVTSSVNCYLTDLQIRGRQWGTVEERKVSEDGSSQGVYGVRRFVLDTPFLQDPNFAASHAAAILADVKDDRASATVQIEAREDLQFAFDLMSPVDLSITAFDISATYYVMGLKHEWSRGAQSTVTTLDLAQIVTDASTPTPANVLSEPAQAPLGYENPAGDSETTSSVEDQPDDGSLNGTGASTSGELGIYCTLYANSATNEASIDGSGYINWGTGADSAIAIYSWLSDDSWYTPNDIKIYPPKSGTYLVTFDFVYRRNSPTAIDGGIRAELYSQAGVIAERSLLTSSAVSTSSIYDATISESKIFSVTDSGMYFKFYTSFLVSPSSFRASMTCIRIGDAQKKDIDKLAANPFGAVTLYAANTDNSYVNFADGIEQVMEIIRSPSSTDTYVITSENYGIFDLIETEATVVIPASGIYSFAMDNLRLTASPNDSSYNFDYETTVSFGAYSETKTGTQIGFINYAGDHIVKFSTTSQRQYFRQGTQLTLTIRTTLTKNSGGSPNWWGVVGGFIIQGA